MHVAAGKAGRDVTVSFLALPPETHRRAKSATIAGAILDRARVRISRPRRTELQMT